MILLLEIIPNPVYYIPCDMKRKDFWTFLYGSYVFIIVGKCFSFKKEGYHVS